MPTRRRDLLRQALFAAIAVAPWLPPSTAEARQARKPRHPAPRPPTRPTRADRRPLIVLDPGHGGKDPGCIGLAGTLEKQVVLSLGLELRRQLLASGRYRVAMTRETDVFIPLGDRVTCARRHGATLFVSLHANSSPDRRARGACVYRFAYRASDRHAASLARWENSADRFAEPAFRGASRQVTHILATLMRRETQVHSARLQRSVAERLDDHVPMLPTAMPHARFAVLSAPDIAGVLVEIGFLTNRKEEALLRTSAHRRVLATSMRRAVDNYVAGLPRARGGRG